MNFPTAPSNGPGVGADRGLTARLERARSYVQKIPGAVQGNHGDSQTLAVANALVWDFALDHSEALTILREYNQRCSPQWTEAELIRKLQSAEKQPHSKPRGNLLYQNAVFSRPAAPRPTQPLDPATAIENYLREFSAGEADLWEASPIRPCEDWRNDAPLLVSQLYDADEQVNIVTSYSLGKDGKARPDGMGQTMTRDEWLKYFSAGGIRESEAGAWIRMNPVDLQGIGDANVTSFRFALLECDNVPVDLQLSLFARLPLPIVTLLTSGARSVHAWVRIEARDADDYRQTVGRMLTLLARFGVDSKNKNPSRLSRLPGVQRTIGATGDGLQRIIYLAPEPERERILL